MPWSHEPKSNSSKSKSRRKNLGLKRGSSWFLYFVCRASVWSKTPEWVQTKDTQRQKDIADDEMQQQKKRRCVCNMRELHCTAHSLIYRSSCFRTPMNMPIPFCVSSTLDCDFLLLVLLLLLHLVVGPFSCFHKGRKKTQRIRCIFGRWLCELFQYPNAKALFLSCLLFNQKRNHFIRNYRTAFKC